LRTAIASLEDQMVPQQNKGSHRFATSGAATSIDDPFARPDESRVLGRGAKAKKQNKEALPAERLEAIGGDNQLSPQAASFRDFRKKAKSQAPTSSPADYSSDKAAESVSNEPGPLAKLPGDITAEELSALSEVAARLNEAAPAQSVTASTETSGAETSAGISGETPLQSSAEIADSQLEHEVAHLPVVEDRIAASSVYTAPEDVVTSPVQESHETESTESVEPSKPTVKAWEISVAKKNEIEIPVAQLEPAKNDEPAAIERQGQVESLPVESLQIESQPAESQSDSQDSNTQLPDAVSTASFAEEPAAIDQQDEPMFASAHALEAYAEEMTQRAEAYASSAIAPASEPAVENVSVYKNDENENKEQFASIDSSFAQAAFAESTSPEPASTESSPVEVPVSESISTEAAPVAEAAEPEAPMPSEAELAEALRLLMPATAQAEVATPPAETVSATSQWSDNEETMEISAGKRWVAEALTLTPEEASMSLEAEMFRAFAANAEKIEALPVDNPLAAIQLAVENRLAAEAAAAAESAREGAPKAMAAVAPAGTASATSAETDIASIVDKVMADLRPKIVEEIARKLSGK
jgi:hypothetical protein